MTVYEDSEGLLTEITIEMSEENLSDEVVSAYRERTVYALKAIFTELDDGSIDWLYQRLTTDYFVFDNEEEAGPVILYYKNGKGCYSYFRSAVDRVHIVPADGEYLSKLESSGNVTIEDIII